MRTSSSECMAFSFAITSVLIERPLSLHWFSSSSAERKA
ncbi:Uncharacterised protein [Vibrio cholerae]|nr:Uncharacterised protein [Vibrio cholerae]